MKLTKAYETETYISDGGYYCIRQEEWPDGEAVVLLTPAQMRQVIQDMERMLENTSWFSDQVEE